MKKLLIGILGVIVLCPPPISAQQTLSPAYQVGRGQLVRGDFDAALDAFNRAIESAPKQPEYYDARGLTEIHQYKVDAAMKDFAQAITLDKNYAHAYYDRALAEMMNGGLDAAEDDFEHLLKLYPTNTDLPHFYLWMTQVQLDQKDAANRRLMTYLATRPAEVAHDWNAALADFLLGKLSEADFLKRANSTPVNEDKARVVCEAYYFVGMKRLIAGDKLGATESFRKALETNQVQMTEYPLSHAAFDALGGTP